MASVDQSLPVGDATLADEKAKDPEKGMQAMSVEGPPTEEEEPVSLTDRIEALLPGDTRMQKWLTVGIVVAISLVTSALVWSHASNPKGPCTDGLEVAQPARRLQMKDCGEAPREEFEEGLVKFQFRQRALMAPSEVDERSSLKMSCDQCLENAKEGATYAFWYAWVAGSAPGSSGTLLTSCSGTPDWEEQLKWGTPNLKKEEVDKATECLMNPLHQSARTVMCGMLTPENAKALIDQRLQKIPNTERIIIVDSKGEMPSGSFYCPHEHKECVLNPFACPDCDKEVRMRRAKAFFDFGNRVDEEIFSPSLTDDDRFLSGLKDFLAYGKDSGAEVRAKCLWDQSFDVDKAMEALEVKVQKRYNELVEKAQKINGVGLERAIQLVLRFPELKPQQIAAAVEKAQQIDGVGLEDAIRLVLRFPGMGPRQILAGVRVFAMKIKVVELTVAAHFLANSDTPDEAADAYYDYMAVKLSKKYDISFEDAKAIVSSLREDLRDKAAIQVKAGEGQLDVKNVINVIELQDQVLQRQQRIADMQAENDRLKKVLAGTTATFATKAKARQAAKGNRDN